MLEDLKTRARALGTADDVIAELEGLGLLWWHVAHQEPDPNKRPPISADRIECGWFAVSTGAHAPIVPASIWRELDSAGEWTGELIANRGFRQAGPLKAKRIDIEDVRKSWVWIAKKPISYQRYEAALGAGKWPEDVREIGEGHNAPPAGYEAIRDAIAQQQAEAMAWFDRFPKDEKTGLVALPDKEAADKAMRLREELLKLHGLADEERKAEKEPHLTASTAVDTKWMEPCVKKAKAAADKLYTAWKSWGDKERRAREKAALDAVASNAPLASIKPVEPVKFQGAARAVPLRTKKICKVEDHAAALEFLKDRPELKEFVARLCQQLYDSAGIEVPGTRIERAVA